MSLWMPRRKTLKNILLTAPKSLRRKHSRTCSIAEVGHEPQLTGALLEMVVKPRADMAQGVIRSPRRANIWPKKSFTSTRLVPVATSLEIKEVEARGVEPLSE